METVNIETVSPVCDDVVCAQYLCVQLGHLQVQLVQVFVDESDERLHRDQHSFSEISIRFWASISKTHVSDALPSSPRSVCQVRDRTRCRTRHALRTEKVDAS